MEKIYIQYNTTTIEQMYPFLFLSIALSIFLSNAYILTTKYWEYVSKIKLFDF